MNITLATGLYPSEIGGPATYAALLESELPSRGIDVRTVPYGWVRQYPKIVRLAVYTWKLWRESKRADAVYALDAVSVGLPALLVATLRRKPLLVRLEGDYAWEQGRMRFGVHTTLDEYRSNPKSAPLAVRSLAFIQTYVVSRAAVVIVPSAHLKSIVTQWGVDAKKISVVYSALYPLTVSGTRDSLRTQLEYSQPTLVSAARLVPWKGFRVLIEVVAKLTERFPDISLVIIGDGEERSKLEALVTKKQLSTHIRFTGRISKDALGAAIKAADVFVLNSAYEGLSHQLIEVMDVGVPIVTTTSGGNPELITNGVNGYLVDFNDATQLEEAIVRVVNHPESKERMTQAARLRSKDFQQKTVVEGIVTVLKNTLAKK